MLNLIFLLDICDQTLPATELTVNRVKDYILFQQYERNERVCMSFQNRLCDCH